MNLESTFLSLDEAGRRLGKTAIWLRRFLDQNPPPENEKPYYRQLGRRTTLSEHDFIRIARKVADYRFGEPKQRPKLGHEGHVYFVLVQGMIKIGWSSDYEARIDHMRTSFSEEPTLVGLFQGTRRHERLFHQRFEHCRARGEWFWPKPDLVEFIQQKTRDGLWHFDDEDEEEVA